jgi:hypothetical protein
MNIKSMKTVILIMVFSLLMQSMAGATQILCVQNDTKIVCTDTDTEPPSKGLFIAAAEYIVIEIAKSVAVEMVKDLIIQEYKKRFGKTVAPDQITVVKK